MVEKGEYKTIVRYKWIQKRTVCHFAQYTTSIDNDNDNNN